MHSVRGFLDARRMKSPGLPNGHARNIQGGWGGPLPQNPSTPRRLRLAVIARIRHEHTRYDSLLMQHGDRRLARAEVRAEIDRILQLWEAGTGVTAEPGGPRTP